MHASSPAHADQLPPPRLRSWAAAAISASIIAVYIVILAMPSAGSDRQRAELHAALAVLGGAISWVEASYADGDLEPGDRHLGLPASAAFCARLSIHLPDNGRARLTCQVQSDVSADATLILKREPQGTWLCVADVADARWLPGTCSDR
ncbi:pilin [Stenotrophomonas sp. SAU14A_NAIMI4_5]|uniref:pilin n=1 Tax=Stenotrophomonas sp. SAU14A_NAIMI4_5 TaxID=2072413 RepID=UPI0020B12360|nr:pilin [Stenotrophomonas sp. SAU14A_NAIMI4_5]